MKIYTEEQVNKIALQAKDFGYYDIPKPIELPSDEEILYTGQNHAQKMHKNDAMITFRKYSTDDFKAGAKWVIEQIKQQDNDQ